MSEEVEKPEVVESTPAPVETAATEAASVSEEVTPEVEKKFSQEEMDRILEKRLARERRKFESKLDKTLRAIESKTPDAPAVIEPPKREAFASDEDYALALVDYRTEVKASQLFEKREKAAREAQERAERQRVEQAYQQRVEAAQSKYDDFEDVAFNPELPITDAMAQAIQLSEQGPDIAYYLGKNLEEAKRIASLPPLLAVKELGKLEAKLSAPTPAKKPSSAPAPISPIRPDGGMGIADLNSPDALKKLGTTALIDAWNRQAMEQARNR